MATGLQLFTGKDENSMRRR